MPKKNYVCQVIYDVDPETPDKGASYMHCQRCIKEMPQGTSPKEWSRQQMAVTAEGHFQLWCTRHDINIALMEIKLGERNA